MNDVRLSGKVYRPKVRFTAKGTAVWEASIGVSRKVKDEWRTDYFNLVSIGKLAEELGDKITDSMKVTLRGALRQDRWEDKEGKKMQRVTVMVFEVAPYGNDDKAKEGQAHVEDDDPF